jgi:MOSC domain-containing protein YiiM
MFQGQLLAIYIGEVNQADLQRVEQVEAVAGRGLAGDRYFRREGAGKPEQEVTLIESEALEALAREDGIEMEPARSRRNLLTRGVPLNHLVGREFSVGEVRLCGIQLCEPCGHLEKLTVAGVKNGLCHRGGLRAQVLQGGTLRTGDVIQPFHKPEALAKAPEPPR